MRTQRANVWEVLEVRNKRTSCTSSRRIVNTDLNAYLRKRQDVMYPRPEGRAGRARPKSAVSRYPAPELLEIVGHDYALDDPKGLRGHHRPVGRGGSGGLSLEVGGGVMTQSLDQEAASWHSLRHVPHMRRTAFENLPRNRGSDSNAAEPVHTRLAPTPLLEEAIRGRTQLGRQRPGPNLD